MLAVNTFFNTHFQILSLLTYFGVTHFSFFEFRNKLIKIKISNISKDMFGFSVGAKIPEIRNVKNRNKT